MKHVKLKGVFLISIHHHQFENIFVTVKAGKD